MSSIWRRDIRWKGPCYRVRETRLKPQIVTEWISNLRKVTAVSSAPAVSSAKWRQYNLVLKGCPELGHRVQERTRGVRGTWLGTQDMAARFITVVGIIRHVGNQRTPPEEDKQIEPKQRLSRAKERHKSCARAWQPARFQFLLPTETPRTEPRTRKLIRGLLGVVTRHLSHPLCDCQVPVGTGTMRHQGRLSATASRVPQRISKWSTGREWRRQNSMHQRTTFRIRAIREDETGKNGTGWTFPYHPIQPLPTPNPDVTKVTWKNICLKCSICTSHGHTGVFPLYLSQHLSFLLSVSLSLSLSCMLHQHH